MIFPSAADRLTVWHAIRAAVQAGDLGHGASLEPPPGPWAAVDPERVVCVYTRDFRDVAEVTRVLEALAEIGAVRREVALGIGYKIDAYERLGIWWDNDYGLRESIYSSREVFQGLSLIHI